ncbi:MAG: sporulation integral membrane protein YtvI [Clostridia bacterium]|nr:sporulation integral membrane protein YtvI [Clostridia bacterium]
MDKERLRHYAYIIFAILGTGILLYLFMKHIFMIALPFLIGWGLAFLVRPLSKRLCRLTRLPYKISSLILTVLIVLTVFGGVIALIWRLSVEAWQFFSGMSGEALYGILTKILNPLSGFFGDSEGALELEIKIGEAVENMLSSALSGIGSLLTAFAASLPSVFIFLLITVIASVYFSLDLDVINASVIRVLPSRVSGWLVRFKRGFFTTGVRYLRSYAILMAVTFAIILAGLLILKVEFALLLAIAIAALDILPVFGVGTVLVPWSVFQMLFGDLGLGIGLLVLFVIHEIIRQVIEPRIVGKNLGIHPIITLVLLYAGYSLFGILGIVLLPVFTVVIDVFSNKENSPKVDKTAPGE